MSSQPRDSTDINRSPSPSSAQVSAAWPCWPVSGIFAPPDLINQPPLDTPQLPELGWFVRLQRVDEAASPQEPSTSIRGVTPRWPLKTGHRTQTQGKRRRHKHLPPSPSCHAQQSGWNRTYWVYQEASETSQSKDKELVERKVMGRSAWNTPRLHRREAEKSPSKSISCREFCSVERAEPAQVPALDTR